MNGIHDVTVIGVAADFGVRWAIDGLLIRGFNVSVPSGLMRELAGALMIFRSGY